MLNFANSKTFMTVSSQVKFLLVLNFAVWDTIAKKQKIVPANNCNLKVCMFVCHGPAQY